MSRVSAYFQRPHTRHTRWRDTNCTGRYEIHLHHTILPAESQEYLTDRRYFCERKEIILREIAVIDEALAIVCDRMDTDDRISDALLREVIECTENIKEAVDA